MTMKTIIFYIAGVLVMAATMTSCVSKKKFEELARAKRLSDREIAVLQGRTDSLLLEMATLRDGFNEIRYQLTLNNAAKDRVIDELSGKLRALESKESALKTELKDAHEAAKVNVMNKESELATLQEEVKRRLSAVKGVPPAGIFLNAYRKYRHFGANLQLVAAIFSTFWHFPMQKYRAKTLACNGGILPSHRQVPWLFSSRRASWPPKVCCRRK